MKIPPKHEVTPDLISLLAKIETSRTLISSFKLVSALQNKIQRISLLKSSLFSAKIEGNPLTIEDLDLTQKEKHTLEVANILSANRFINTKLKSNGTITKKNILEIHKIVMKHVGGGGYFRDEPGAIFNSAGIAVYFSPPPSHINELIEKLLSYIHSDKEQFPLITALVAHLVFEKIHPFIDGNGRVGRLLISAVLKIKNKSFGIPIPFEHYINTHKNDYYYHLDTGLSNTNDYLVFMLEAIQKEADNLITLIEQEQKKSSDLYLLPPRQEEIFTIVQDHKAVSFDFLKRRFMKIPSRTIRYDLKKLVDKKYLVKIGTTRGTYYKIKIKK